MTITFNAAHVTVHGTLGPVPLVLLHAIGLDRHAWDPVLAALPASAGAIACDLRGHGSADATPPTTLEAHADDVVAMLDAFAIERAHVVGISYGGAVAEVFALRHPERVAALGLFATFARTNPEVLNARADGAEQAGIEAQLDETLQRWFSPAELAQNGPGVCYARERLRADRVANWAAAWRALATHDVADRLRTIAVPTTVVAGEFDTSATAEMMRTTIADVIPQATFEVIAGAHHMLVLEEPRRIAGILARR
jgi:3-oxoadipate enol-lactonase